MVEHFQGGCLCAWVGEFVGVGVGVIKHGLRCECVVVCGRCGCGRTFSRWVFVCVGG